MKVVPGGKSPTQAKWEDQQVSGVNAHRPVKNTHSQTREETPDPLELLPPDIRDWLSMKLILWIVTQN